MTLPRFYPIVDDVSWLERLLPLGIELVQLRIKNAPAEELVRQVRLARDMCRASGAQLVVNDHWQLAIDEGCDFVHLGQEDLRDADLAALRRANISLGLSSHDEHELEAALSAEPDYVALGPIYSTVLKKMPWAPQGLDRVRLWKSRIGDLPLVAIGGLTVERAPDVFAAGADTVSVVTDILQHAAPEQRVVQWLEACR